MSAMDMSHMSVRGQDNNSDSVERPSLLAGQEFPPAPRQERSRLKRDALLQAALALFAEQGYEETTIEQIAHRANVAVGGFYQHFTSKKQVLLVLMDRLLEEIAGVGVQPLPDQPLTPYTLIEQVVRQGLIVDWSYAGAYRAWHQAAASEKALQDLHRQIERWSAHLVEELLEALHQLPGARSDADIPTLAWLVSLLFWRLAETPLTEPEHVIATLTSLIFHALFSDAAG